MAFIPVPNTVQCNMVYLWDNQRCLNTLYFEAPSEYTTAEMLTLAGELYDWWDVHFQPLQSASVSLEQIEVVDLTFQGAPGIVYTTGLPQVGGKSATPALPNNVTVSTTFLTLLRGRNYRGRNYFIGLTEADVTANSVGGAVVAAITDAYEQLMDITTISYGTWSVVSRYLNNAPRVSGIATEITGVRTEDTVDSQRRRLPGRGQ